MPYDDILRIAERDDDDPPEAPDLPTDEPKPAPVQDPPAEPDTTPYVVGGTEGPGPFLRESTMNDSGGQISRGGRGRLVDGTGSEPSDAPHRAEYNTPVSPERFGE
jgi:hypothetical protein